MLAARCTRHEEERHEEDDPNAVNSSTDSLLRFEVQEQYPHPKLSDVDDVLIRIHACCLDEDDIRMHANLYPELLPHPSYTPSYACSGVITALGSEVAQQQQHLHIGDEVIVLVPCNSEGGAGACAEWIVQKSVNVFPKPSSLSHESACSIVWSGIQGFTTLHYQLHCKPGERILVIMNKMCNDIVLSSLAGIFGTKLIVATHTPEAYALFTSETSITPIDIASTITAATASSSAAAANDAATSSTPSSASTPLNPLSHILRVIDCSSFSNSTEANTAVLAAVMEETGGLGVDGIIDLQTVHDEWNYLLMLKHLTVNEKDAATASTSSSAASSPDPSLLHPSPPSALSTLLSPSHPILFSTLLQCLAVQGRFITSTPNLQVDPPSSRQLFLRGASLAYAFTQNWILGATQRGKLAHVVTEVLALAARGILQPSIHSRYAFTPGGMASAWQTLTSGCAVGKVVVTQAKNMTITNSMSNESITSPHSTSLDLEQATPSPREIAGDDDSLDAQLSLP